MNNFININFELSILIVVFLINAISVILGSCLLRLFPENLQVDAKFYLSPVLGLAFLILLGQFVGRNFILGSIYPLHFLLYLFIAFSFYLDNDRLNTIRNIFKTYFLTLTCGLCLLIPIFGFGTFNLHTDAFTYLVHSSWLQTHSFSEAVKPESVTPFNSQIFLYQQAGLRMGASYLMALLQSIFNVKWSYTVYFPLMIVAISACCAAIGMPLANKLREIRFPFKVLLLSLPALSVGGLVFGGYYGFLPQVVGLSLVTGFMLGLGAVLKFIKLLSFKKITFASIPIALLLSSAIFAYSEITPFIILSLLGSTLIWILLKNSPFKSIALTTSIIVIATLFLNLEIIRVINAIILQSGIVVGGPVDWPLIGFLSHAFGLHGGVWDVFQWSKDSGSIYFYLSATPIFILIGLILWNFKFLIKNTFYQEFLPAIVLMAIFIILFMYFRYLVPSPFEKGIGQSWNQFKLSEWIFPFTMVLVEILILNLFRISKFFFYTILICLFSIGILTTVQFSIDRSKSVSNYYGEGHLENFYKEFQNAIKINCSQEAPLYLSLKDEHHKFRQIAVYLLPNREIKSNWMEDSFIYPYLPLELRTTTPMIGDCIVERIGLEVFLQKNTETVGKFRVGMYQNPIAVKIDSVNNAYDIERDSNNWWYWVKDMITFKFITVGKSEQVSTKLYFEYVTKTQQTITLNLIFNNGVIVPLKFIPKVNSLEVFEMIFKENPTQLRNIIIETDSEAGQLSDIDSRRAAFMVRNLVVSSSN